MHADWSVGAKGRWVARATRRGDGWLVASAPSAAGPLDAFTDDLLSLATDGAVLAGFDFPIGLPAHYARTTGFSDFPAALDHFGEGAWSDFYAVADAASDIRRERPFYPQRTTGRVSRQHLLHGHGVDTIADLTRDCERGGDGRKAAGCMFWTLGANQVGKAMATGWREVVRPARRRGAHLWPFDGDLNRLAACGGLTLCETYPADVYARLNAGFGPRESKTRQADRAGKAAAILAWAADSRVTLAPVLNEAIRDGFGAIDKGGDRFDAMAGLLGMIDVISGRRHDGAPASDKVRRWEGWILGRSP